MSPYHEARYSESVPVVNKIVQTNSAKSKVTVVYGLIFLVKVRVRILQKSVPVRRAIRNGSSLIIVCVCKKVEFSLPDINIASAIELSTHIDSSPNITIVA